MAEDKITKKKFKINRFQSILFIVLTLLAIYVLLRSPLFNIKDIVVIGNENVEKEVILDTVSIHAGENIFGANLKDEIKRLELIPMIKSVEINRNLPDVIEINVEERVPKALLLIEHKLIQIDSEGIYINEGSFSDEGLPFINGISCTVSTKGKAIKGEDVDKILQIINQFPQNLLVNLSEINITKEDGVDLYTLDGIYCKMGAFLDLEKKRREPICNFK